MSSKRRQPTNLIRYTDKSKAGDPQWFGGKAYQDARKKKVKLTKPGK
jgi:hypothetical protein